MPIRSERIEFILKVALMSHIEYALTNPFAPLEVGVIVFIGSENVDEV